MDLSKLTDWIKLEPRYLFAISLATAFLLFLPNQILQQIGLDQLRDNYRPWIGGGFLIAIVLYLTTGLSKGITWIAGERERRSALRDRNKQLEKLTIPERQILKGFIDGKTRTRYLDINSGVVNGLVAKDVIYRAADMALDLYGFGFHCDFNMQPWAWEHLNKHPELLHIAEEEPEITEETK
jgi:hypothetical protein